MSLSHLNQIEYEKAQNRKIIYFFMKTGDIDYKRAEKYLNQANWNEELAVKFFHDIHPNYIPHYIIKINHDLINKEYKDLKSDIKKENSDKELNNIFFNGNKNNKDLNSDIKEENIEKNPNKYSLA